MFFLPVAGNLPVCVPTPAHQNNSHFQRQQKNDGQMVQYEPTNLKRLLPCPPFARLERRFCVVPMV